MNKTKNESELTVYVCPKSCEIIIFRSIIPERLIEFREVETETSIGRITPIDWIRKNWNGRIIPYKRGSKWLQRNPPPLQGTTSEKGAWAELMFAQYLRRQAIDFNLIPKTEVFWQTRGIDVVLRNGASFQVKYDGRGGTEKEGGSGFLYIETHERNPCRMY